MPDPMSAIARAYIAEYGAVPTTRFEQDRYGAFKFGFQAGHKAGYREALAWMQDAIERDGRADV